MSEETDFIEKGIHAVVGKKAIIHYKHEIRIFARIIKYALVGAALVTIIPPPDIELLVAPLISSLTGINLATSFIIMYSLAGLILYLFARNKLKHIFIRVKKFITGA